MENRPPSDQPPYGGGNYPPPNQPPSGGNYPPPNQPPSGGNYPPPSNQPPPGGNYPPPQQPYPGNYAPPPGQPYGVTGYPPGQAPGYVPLAPKKRGFPLWIGILLGVIVLSILGCVGGFALLISSGVSAKNDSEKVLAQFMQAARDGNSDQAYSFFAPDARIETSQQQLATYLESRSSFLEQYDRIESGSSTSYSNSNGRETLNFTGNIFYKTAGKGTFDATMQKVGGNWMIYNLKLNPPA